MAAVVVDSVLPTSKASSNADKESSCVICMDPLHATSAASAATPLWQCRHCRKHVHRHCFDRWAAKQRERGRHVRCVLCTAVITTAMDVGAGGGNRVGVASSGPGRRGMAVAVVDGIDMEMTDMELEAKRNVFRRRMHNVLTESFYRKSPLWRPVRVEAHADSTPASTPLSSTSAVPTTPASSMGWVVLLDRPLIDMKIFQTMSHFDRTFNMLHGQRTRWQDGSFHSFFRRWQRFEANEPTDAQPSGIGTLLRLFGRLSEPETALYTRVIDAGSSEDITTAVRGELSKVHALNDTIHGYSLELARVEPALVQRRRLEAATDDRLEREATEEEDARRARLAAAVAWTLN